MRAFIIWTLSILLGFEPALFAAGRNNNAEIKAFLENAQVTQKPVTLKELYSKNFDYLPESVRADFETFIKKNGSYRKDKRKFSIRYRVFKRPNKCNRQKT